MFRLSHRWSAAKISLLETVVYPPEDDRWAAELSAPKPAHVTQTRSLILTTHLLHEGRIKMHRAQMFTLLSNHMTDTRMQFLFSANLHRSKKKMHIFMLLSCCNSSLLSYFELLFKKDMKHFYSCVKNVLKSFVSLHLGHLSPSHQCCWVRSNALFSAHTFFNSHAVDLRDWITMRETNKTSKHSHSHAED